LAGTVTSTSSTVHGSVSDADGVSGVDSFTAETSTDGATRNDTQPSVASPDSSPITTGTTAILRKRSLAAAPVKVSGSRVASRFRTSSSVEQSMPVSKLTDDNQDQDDEPGADADGGVALALQQQHDAASASRGDNFKGIQFYFMHYHNVGASIFHLRS
jgi:hypothetical protein